MSNISILILDQIPGDQTKKVIVIIDYKLGNLRSVIGAVERLGHEALISSRVEDMEAADKLILPGVGAYGDGMVNLRSLGLVEPLTRMVVTEGKPILGICLGSQLLARVSYEFGTHPGLGWIEAEVVRLEPEDSSLRVPHVGWDDLVQVRESVLYDDVPQDALFYYVHSFHIKCDNQDIVIGMCDYGGDVTAAFQQGNIYGTQFHPEKSQRHGLTLLGNFLDKA